jgi:hypothetical protein
MANGASRAIAKAPANADNPVNFRMPLINVSDLFFDADINYRLPEFT